MSFFTPVKLDLNKVILKSVRTLTIDNIKVHDWWCRLKIGEVGTSGGKRGGVHIKVIKLLNSVLPSY